MVGSRNRRIVFGTILIVATYVVTFFGLRYLSIQILHFPAEFVRWVFYISFAILIPFTAVIYFKSVKRFYRGEELNLEFELARISSIKYLRIIFGFLGLVIIPVFAMMYGLVFTLICSLVFTPFDIGPENVGRIVFGLSSASALVTYYFLWRGLRKSFPS